MKVPFFKFLSVYILIGTFLLGATGGENERGALKYFTNYLPLEEFMQPQSWGILQDNRGIIYIANNGGLIEFDGAKWQFTDLPNQTVRSLAMDEKGMIYVGGQNELGVLGPEPNGTGARQYVSLMAYIDEDKRNFGNVWRTYATKEGIYYWTSAYLFRWRPSARRMSVWQPESGFIACLSCGNTLYVRQKKIGLQKMINGSLVPLPGGDTFADESIYMIAPYTPGGEKLLIGTHSKGLFIHDSLETVSFKTEIDDYLKEKRLYHGIRLASSPGDFALASSRGGLVIIDSGGRLRQVYDKTSGLQDNSVNYVFEDSRGNIWLALNKGIAKIEYASPFSIYDGERSQLPGIILSVVRRAPHEALYAGTTTGLFLRAPSGAFQPVPGISRPCWSLLAAGDSILAATSSGVYQVKKQAARKILGNTSYVLSRSRSGKNRIRIGTDRGLTSLSLNGEEWTVEYIFEQISTMVRTIEEDDQGDLWLGTLTGNVLRVEFPGAVVKGNAVVTVYGAGQGLPPGEIHVSRAQGHVMFATAKGLFRFDRDKKAFIPDNTLGGEFAGGPGGIGVFRLVEDKNKHIYFHSKRRNFRAVPRPGGDFIIDGTPFRRIPLVQVNSIYPDPDGTAAWFAANNSLVRYDSRIKKDYTCDYPAFVRRVLIDGVEEKGRFPIIPYRNRNVRFGFAAPFYEAESETLYQFLLQGYDNDWSDWTKETKKDYTNLDAGTYTFRVRAKNVYGHLSKEDVFRFKVLPPWCQTWWAYIIYACGAVLLFYLAVKWRHRQLVKEKRKLEQTVKDRTREIEDKNRQLEIQSEQLKELDEAKSRFFANISHEFRTPLTLIMGPLEQILAKDPEKDLKEKAHLMLRNSRRLLNLINQLLELARLDSGKMKLEASGQNIVPFLKRVVMCFESMAEQNKVNLIFINKEDDILLYFDEEKLEKVITNLLSNAFKYTPAQGTITVTVRRAAGTEGFPSGCVEISVRDTGTGIPENQLPYIFDRFHRVEGSHEHKQKGSGIGLALTKELVELHHGKIEVKSSCRDDHSRGSEFILRLPPGKEHLQVEEITDADKPPARRAMKSFDQTFSKVWPVTHRQVPPEASKKAGKEENPLILVVDDNTDVRKYIRGSLEPYFKVVEAGDGKQGILRAKEIIPDLIISDVMMPETDGFELSRALKKDVLTCHIPIILLTAKVSEESVLEGLEAGADDYITKPFSSELLVVRVRNLIELRRQLQLEKKNRMTLQPEEIPVSPLDDEFYKKLLYTLETNLSDPDFNVEALSRTLQMSHATLYRKIQALTGKTPTIFIRSFRIKRAAQLLQVHAGNISDVVDKVGFADKSYFTKCFREQFNRSPSDFQPSGTGPGLAGEEPDADMVPAGPAVTPEGSAPAKEIVLVVEDNDDARRFIRESLEPDFRVVEAADGSEGLTRTMETIPDLVISDIMMPGMDGYELCGLLKKDVRTSHIPVVLLTAKASEESRIRGLETGADDYITKPFNAKILLARIKNIIRLRSHLQKERNREMALLPAKIKESETHREFVKELDAVIEKNLEDPEFNVEQLAKKLYMSSATLFRKIQAVSGEVPSEYIRSFRLRRAAELLKSNFGSITEVAFEVGFNSRRYFTKCFKEQFHQLPSVYMETE